MTVILRALCFYTASLSVPALVNESDDEL